MKELYDCLCAHNLTIASCESLTGGLFCTKLTEIPHASNILKGGIVSYWTEIKENVVGVSKNVIEQFGVISEECAIEMAKHIQKIFDVDVAVSFTGNAGPNSMEGKEVGLIYTCIIIDEKIYTFQDVIKVPRNELRNIIVDETAKRIVQILGKNINLD